MTLRASGQNDCTGKAVSEATNQSFGSDLIFVSSGRDL